MTAGSPARRSTCSRRNRSPATRRCGRFPSVIVSPHVCGDVEGWEGAVMRVFLDNLERFTRNEPLRNVVDTAAGFGVG